MTGPEPPSDNRPATPGEGARLRLMTPADLEAVLGVEAVSHPDPWSATMLRDSLEHGDACRVAEQGGAILGHAILRVTGPEAEILNLCVHPDYRNHRLGRALLQDLVEFARQAGAEEIFLEVRESNGHARRLYDGEAFHEVGWRERYYRGPEGWEDAVIMARHLGPAGGRSPAGGDR